MLRKCIAIALCCFFLIAPIANAATCQEIRGKQVCLLKLKRSAKYYYEYRATISIDGRKQPERFYDCRDLNKSSTRRDRYYTEPNGTKVYFRKDDPLAKSVCRLYKKF